MSPCKLGLAGAVAAAPTAAISLSTLLIMRVAAVGAPWLTPYSSRRMNIATGSPRRRQRTGSAPTSSAATC